MVLILDGSCVRKKQFLSFELFKAFEEYKYEYRSRQYLLVPCVQEVFTPFYIVLYSNLLYKMG